MPRPQEEALRLGIKIPLTNPKQSVKEFAEMIKYLYHHREELQRMSEGCKAKQLELSWERKAEQMVEIYYKAMDNPARMCHVVE